MNEYYHCKTQEEYDWLMKKFDEEGHNWMNGDCITGYNAPSYWSEYEGETVIKVIKELSFADLKFYKKHEFVTKFINVGELMEKEGEFNLPKHYDVPNLKQSVIDIMMAFAKFNCEGNIELAWYYTSVLKRVFRWKHKDGKEDLKKAKFFIDKMLDYLENEVENAD